MKKAMCMMISCLLAVGILFSIQGVEAEDNHVVIENDIVYANGTAIFIKKDGASAYLYNERNEKLSDYQVTASTIIYGGAKNQDISSDVKISIDNVKVNSIYGGGYSDGSHSADVDGHVTIIINGKVNVTKLYGGGHADAQNGNAQANVNGNISVQIYAQPTSNHSGIHGGGYSYTKTNYQATANVNATTVYVTGRVDSVYGGGYANQTNGGKAIANVKNKVSLQFDRVDIREIYGGGNSVGSQTQANCQSVAIQVNQSEVAILYGGGITDNGQANVDHIEITLESSRFYASLYGGGSAQTGQANVLTTHIQFNDSDIYVYKQSDQLVSGTIYVGGNASSNGGAATVQEAILEMNRNTSAGNIYCGGDEYNGGNAYVKNIDVKMVAQDGSYNTDSSDETLYYGSIFGSGDHNKHAPKNVNMEIVDSSMENIWGSIDEDNYPSPLSQNAHVEFKGSNHVDNLAAFDTMTVEQPLYLKMILGKDRQRPTQLIQSDDIAVGTPLVYCQDIDGVQDVLTLKNGKLDYQIVDNQSQWLVGQMTYDIKTIASEHGIITSSSTVHKNESILISWQPDEGYEVTSVIVDGVEKSTDLREYQFDKVSAHHTIEVVFTRIPGQVADEVIVQQAPNGPHTEIVLDHQKINQLLSDEDKEDIENGVDISFQTSIQIEKSLPDSIKNEVKNIMDDYQTVMNFNIEFFKNRNQQMNHMTKLNVPVRFIIDIPETVRDKQQLFSMVRIHQDEDGQLITTLLPDLDENPQTITFETDCFSYYILVYKDAHSQESQKPSLPVIKDDNEGQSVKPSLQEETPVSNQKIQTGDYTLISFYFHVFCLAICTFVISWKRR